MSSLRIAESANPPSETWLMQLVVRAQLAPGECRRKYKSVDVFQAYCAITVWYLVLSVCIAVCKNSYYFHYILFYTMIEIRKAIAANAQAAKNALNGNRSQYTLRQAKKGSDTPLVWYVCSANGNYFR